MGAVFRLPSGNVVTWAATKHHSQTDHLAQHASLKTGAMQGTRDAPTLTLGANSCARRRELREQFEQRIVQLKKRTRQ